MISVLPDVILTKKQFEIFSRSVLREVKKLSPLENTELKPQLVTFAYQGKFFDSNEIIRSNDSIKIIKADVEVNDKWLETASKLVMKSLGWSEDEELWKAVKPSKKTQNYVKSAKEILKNSWPEANQELETTVKYIGILEGKFRSATNSSTFGTIWCSDTYVDSVLEAYKMLIHESAHHILYLREQFTKFLLNPSDISEHPLRKDLRPVRGVLHSCFAQYRMHLGYSYLLNTQNEIKKDDRDKILSDISLMKTNLLKTIEILKKDAILTADGKELIKSLEEVD